MGRPMRMRETPVDPNDPDVRRWRVNDAKKRLESGQLNPDDNTVVDRTADLLLEKIA